MDRLKTKDSESVTLPDAADDHRVNFKIFSSKFGH